MNTEIQSDAGTETASQHELCDKCGSRMDLQGSAYGFQRWRCPKCQQVVGIDRDPEVGSRFQIARGQPWNYSPDAFKNGPCHQNQRASPANPHASADPRRRRARLPAAADDRLGPV